MEVLANGIDIAFNYQVLQDAHALKNAGIKFVIHKATQGTFYSDSHLQADLAALRAAGIDVASYLFNEPAQSAPAQISFYRASGGTLAVAVDEEITQGLSWPAVAAETKQELDKLGGMLYSNLFFLSNMLGAPWNHFLWLAEPGVQMPTRPCQCWQYGVGSVAGIQGNCDLDVWTGTQSEYDAFFHPTQQAGGFKLNASIVGASLTSAGYSMVGSDGGVFNYGDAKFFGSLGNMILNKPVVDIAHTPSNLGYWLVASDGGVFTFGDAHFYGSAAGKPLNAPVIGIERTPTGLGYYLFCADGGVETFGDAKFEGSPA